jgi:hypothetical protein
MRRPDLKRVALRVAFSSLLVLVLAGPAAHAATIHTLPGMQPGVAVVASEPVTDPATTDGHGAPVGGSRSGADDGSPDSSGSAPGSHSKDSGGSRDDQDPVVPSVFGNPQTMYAVLERRGVPPLESTTLDPTQVARIPVG